MSTAIYAGTLDPITNGHLSIIEQASKSFDTVIILIATNPEKTNTFMFSAENRKNMTELATIHLPNVKVDILKGGYTIHYAERVGATAIIRGLRNEEEFKKERQEFFTFNNFENPAISTVFLMSPPEISHISSSFVKKNCYGITGWVDVIDKYVPAAASQRLQRRHLQKIYEKYMQKDNLFDKLYQAYSSPNRHYHNASHIIRMCDELEDFFRYAFSPDDIVDYNWARTIIIAALFHDYFIESDPKIGDQAIELSINTFLNEFRRIASTNDKTNQHIREIIQATSHNLSTKPSNHAKPVLDADLTIFGQSPATYDKYTAAIRQEYHHIPDKDFTPARIKILKNFLAKDPIYHTKFFREKYESQARKNLTRELQNLNKSVN